MRSEVSQIVTLVPGQLTVCTYAGFAPLCYRNGTGALVGLDIAFMQRFARQLGLAIVALERPFDDIWTQPGSNVCDIAAASIMKREDRHPGAGAQWSDGYYTVRRSLLVRYAEKEAFEALDALSGRTIVVTRGSTAHMDASTRYPRCRIVFVDEVAQGERDVQRHIVTQLMANRKVDAFAEGDICSRHLVDRFGPSVAGGLAVADVHRMAGSSETFNFVVRRASTGLLEQLNGFIAQHGYLRIHSTTPGAAAWEPIDHT
jgi:ABC-type amino acid transport substrate-binding protein